MTNVNHLLIRVARGKVIIPVRVKNPGFLWLAPGLPPAPPVRPLPPPPRHPGADPSRVRACTRNEVSSSGGDALAAQRDPTG